MQNIKFLVFLIIILVLTGLLGYWAIFSIEGGDAHVNKQKQKELEQKNEELLEEVEDLKNEIASLKAAQVEKVPEITPEQPKATTVVSTKHQSLINDLQKLVTDKIYMKEGSRGTRVGTIQTFLNIYNNTSKKVDNDYGASTKADIVKFQKAEGLTADGEAGPSTFSKMIEWLKKQ